MNPTQAATSRRQPTFSLKKAADINMTMIGSTKNTEIASANGMYLRAVKNSIAASPIIIPRRMFTFDTYMGRAFMLQAKTRNTNRNADWTTKSNTNYAITNYTKRERV